MKTNKEKNKFVEMRASGLSFDKIAVELKISKPTLLQWNVELSREIANMSYLEFETLLSQYQLAKKTRIDAFAAMLERAMNELRSRSFQEVNTKDLLAFISSLESKIKEEIRPVHYYTGEYPDPLELIELLSKEKTLPLVY